jgi:hypothetical protein
MKADLLGPLILILAGLWLAGCPNGPSEDSDTYVGTWVFDDGSERVVATIGASSWLIEFFDYPGPDFRESFAGTFSSDGAVFTVVVSEYRFGVDSFGPGDPEYDDLIDFFFDEGYGDGVESITFDYSLSKDTLTLSTVGESYPMTRQ